MTLSLHIFAFLCLSLALDDGAEFFEKQVRPLLIDRCYKCHGDSEKPKGGLRLTSRDAVLKGGDTGAAIVPGKPDESPLVEAVRYRDVLLQMPPKNKLSDSEVAILEKWVALGAPWPESPKSAPSSVTTTVAFTPEQRSFWAFQPIGKSTAPAVQNTAWPRNDIDRFILRKLEAAGIPPAPPADRATLLRRITFDLIGLPPTPAEVDAFINDTAPDAYETVVNRLLDSPAHGERWARHWLDVVRYADSLDSRGSGQPGDILDAWRYRDWVVDALNADMPYDRFVRMQIAGDLLPSDDPAERAEGFNRSGTIATTMLAIGNWGNGDADKDKILTDIADDQVDVVSKAFMGLTVSCARCHDHKFDPIRQRDYYAMAGIFFSTHILPKLTPKGAGETIIRVPLASPAELARREAREKRIAELDMLIAAKRNEGARQLAQSMKPQVGKYLVAAWQCMTNSSQETYQSYAQQRGLQPALLRQWVDFLGGGSLKALDTRNESVGGKPGVVSWTANPAPQASATANTLPQDVTILTFKLPARSISVHPGPQSHAVASWRSPISGRVRVTGRIADGDAACGNGVAWAIDQVGPVGARELASGDLANGAAMAFGQGNGAGKLALVEVKVGDRIDLVVMRKDEYSCDTTTIDLVISSWDDAATWDLTRDCLDSFLAANPHADRLGHEAVWTFADSTRERGARASELEIALTEWRRAVEGVNDSAALEAAAAKFTAAFNVDDARSPFWVRDEAGEALLADEFREQLQALRSELTALRAQTPQPLEFANAAQDGGVPESPHAGSHDVAVHLRGRYDRLGEMVPRGFPAILCGETQPAITKGSGRVELAQWLTSLEHPLTARVIVNRFWQHHFGQGIVRTPSNFGKLGDRPSHPELLDHLARRLVENGWSLKALHREILLSSTYQQASTPTPEALKNDADNRMFSRQNRKRLEAEAIRDNLLAVAGRLDTRGGGPAERDFNVPRRGLYMITIRSDRATFGSLFDQADSTAPVDKRIESTVAPQALFLMNNSFVKQQSKALAVSVAGVPADDRGRIAWLYKTLFGRSPSDDETEIALDVVTSSGNRDAPDAWEALCHILMCSNEFLYVD